MHAKQTIYNIQIWQEPHTIIVESNGHEFYIKTIDHYKYGNINTQHTRLYPYPCFISNER